jgi:nucleoside-diphosphate-sugar epimerase
MAKEELAKIKIQTPVSLLVRGANKLGYELAKVLVEQGSKVIVVDEYSVITKKYVTELKKLKECDFVDFKGYEQLFKTINRLDYLFYEQYTFLLENNDFSSKEFLEESNRLNIALKASVQFNAKFSLLSSVALNKDLALQINNPSYINPSPYSPIELQKYAETLTAEYHDKSKANVRILRLGTILGKDFDILYDKVLKDLVSNAVNSSILTILGEGLDVHFLINSEDAIFGILKLTFSEKTTGEVITLSNITEYTTLSIAYKLLELSPTALDIKFAQDTEKKQILYTQYIPAPNAERYGWKHNVNFEQTLILVLEEAFSRANKSWNRPEKTTLVSKAKSITSSISNVKIERTALGNMLYTLTTPFRTLTDKFLGFFKKRSLPNIRTLAITTIILSILFYFLLGPVISIGISGYLAYRESKTAMTDIQNLNFAESKDNLTNINNYADSIIKSLNRIKWLFDLTQQKELFANIQDLSLGAKLTISGSLNTIDALTPLGEYIKDFEPAIDFQTGVPKTTREYQSYLEEMKKEKVKLVNSSNDILLGLQYINNVNPEKFPTFVQPTIVTIKTRSTEIAGLINPAQKMISFMPDILGIDGRKRYLILLQNPSELRSTGGWISSYGVIGIEAGQVRELTIDDVYNAEGTLRNLNKFYEAPQDMQAALSTKNWSLSLSNWDPDFKQASNSAEFFIQEANIAPEIDGVISINVTLIQDLLKVWGGLEVSGEKELITSENLYSKIFEIHEGFTPGSTTKSTFLTNLSGAIIKRLLTSNVSDYQGISSTILKSLEKKDILIYLKNTQANQYFSSVNWSGELGNEYLSAPSVVQWNWGGNKANLFLQQDAKLTMQVVNVNTIEYSYELNIQNNSVTNTYPEGDYANYMRIILPTDAQITQLDGYNDDFYFEDTVNNKKVVGGWFNVQRGINRKLTLKYTLARTETNGSTFPISTKANKIILNTTLFKQPGLLNTNYSFELSYPESWRTTKYDNLTKLSNFVSASGALDTDKNYVVEWEMK